MKQNVLWSLLLRLLCRNHLETVHGIPCSRPGPVMPSAEHVARPCISGHVFLRRSAFPTHSTVLAGGEVSKHQEFENSGGQQTRGGRTRAPGWQVPDSRTPRPTGSSARPSSQRVPRPRVTRVQDTQGGPGMIHVELTDTTFSAAQAS